MSTADVVISLAGRDDATRPSPARQGKRAPELDAANLTQVFTLVLWLICLAIGWAGLRLPYASPPAPAAAPPPVQAKLITVEVIKDLLAPQPLAVPPLPDVSEPPPPAPDSVAAPPEPPLVAVAEPTPAIAFAAPVEGPAKIVEAKQAVPVRAAPVPPAPARAPAGVQRLTFGEGQGRQPAPEYPRESIEARQQGAVLVRFIVGENGRVSSAQVVTPCRWPLLNQAAVRAVRELWEFGFGPQRSFEVVIRFKLNEQ